MRVLALDTTTADGSIAIVEDHRLVSLVRGHRARSHAERLPHDIVEMLRGAALSARDIDVYAVVAGPGSFTGLRVGIAAIQGLGMVHRTRIVPVSALEALGLAAAHEQPAGTVVAAWMDGRRREIFSTLYRVTSDAAYDPDRVVEVEPAAVGDASTTLARWAAAGTMPAVIAGDGAELYADIIGAAAAVGPHPALAPIVAHLALERAARGLTVDAAGVQPIYVRRPDVEVTRDARRQAERDAAAPPTRLIRP